MKNKNYWNARMQEVEEESYQRSAAYYKDLQEQFRRASNAMQLDIELWYRRLADNNGISYAEAGKFLNTSEREELRWSVEEYIKAGESCNMDPEWMKKLENASARYHISYLEAMKMQAQQHTERLYAEYNGGAGTFLRENLEEQYYRTAWEVSGGIEAGFHLDRLDTRKIDLLLKHPWAQDGKNFSDRIWENKEKLVRNLHTELTQSIIRGEPPRRAAERLAKTMNVSKVQAGTLVYTEAAALSTLSQKECFQKLGVERYQFDATLDGKTCEVCADMDQLSFPLSELEIGMTAPPIHPRCRCCIVPAFDDWEEFGISVERAARNTETDETVYVDGKMDYAEWKAQISSKALQSSDNIDKIKEERRLLDQTEIIEKAKELERSSDYDSCTTFQEVRAVTNSKLGYDGLPKVISKDEFAKESIGKTVLYRGIHGNAEKTAAEIANEFRRGALWTGNTGGAIYGNGVYFTATEDIAKRAEYAGIAGTIIEMVLTDDAKIVDYCEIANEYIEIQKMRMKNSSETYFQIIADVGQYAAIKGYDAIAANGFQGHDYVVLLNRTKAIVKE